MASEIKVMNRNKCRERFSEKGRGIKWQVLLEGSGGDAVTLAEHGKSKREDGTLKD